MEYLGELYTQIYLLQANVIEGLVKEEKKIYVMLNFFLQF